MDRFDPFVKYADVYGDIINWEKDPMNKPQNQNKYFFSDGKTYYEQICKMLRLMSVFKEAFNQIYSNEDEISEAWENFVNNLSASVVEGSEPDVTLTWTDDSVNFEFTMVPGVPGEQGVGITSISFNSDYTMTITLSDGNTYTSMSLKGETGPQGPQGEAGQDGESFRILGIYPTLADLQTAHPTGNTGDAYAVGTATSNVVYNWDVDHLEWKNIGSIQGPQGPQGEQGIQGPQGPQGQTGPQGEAGQGVPASGTAGQALVKSSNTDYDTEWRTLMGVPSTYTSNNLAKLNSNGQIEDSGKSLSDLQELLTAGDGIEINNNVISSKLNMDLLWTNAAPTSSFVGQTISLDLSIYEYCIVAYKLLSNVSVISYSLAKKDGTRTHMEGMSDYQNYRRLTLNANNVVFEDAYHTQPYGAVELDNTKVIPIAIYGIR